MEKNRYIELLYKNPNKRPRRKYIQNTLQDMQNLVKGYIEVIRYKDILLICNKENQIKKKEPNVILNNNITIYGSFFITGDDYENADFISLTPKQIRRFRNEFSSEKKRENEMEEELECL
ncbi:MAG: DUF3846 domain-containing protein [Clostridia bacterium]|nr:DUF3846 domain-containing protein [Clostridia bacterium]